MTASRLDKLLAQNPAKRATERFWLVYTPIWGVLSAVVMVSGWAERWGDAECLTFGLLLAGGALAGPLVYRSPEDRARPLHRTTAFKMALSVLIFSFGLNYTGTPYFYDVLHMHYGFDTALNIRNTPFFLYLVTCAYFATYCVLVSATFRAGRRWLSRRWRWLGWVVAPVAVAFLETALNANPFMTSLFCYDDLGLVLSFGTFSYAIPFVFALPMWMALDERPGESVRAWHVVVWSLAVLYACVVSFDLLRYEVAPHFTIVVEGANGLRDFATSCLAAPR